MNYEVKLKHHDGKIVFYHEGRIIYESTEDKPVDFRDIRKSVERVKKCKLLQVINFYKLNHFFIKGLILLLLVFSMMNIISSKANEISSIVNKQLSESYQKAIRVDDGKIKKRTENLETRLEELRPYITVIVDFIRSIDHEK